MEIATAFFKVFNVILDAARAPEEQRQQILAEGIAREKEAFDVVIAFYANTRGKLDAFGERILAAEKAAREKAERALADLTLRHDALRASVDLAKPVEK